MFSCLLTCGFASLCHSVNTCSLVHMHRTRGMRKAFTETRCAICGSCVRDCTCAPCLFGESQKGLHRVDQDAASSVSPLRENLSLAMWTEPDGGGSFRLPCHHLQNLRKTTLHDVPAVQADFFALHKLSQKVLEEVLETEG